MYPVQIKFNKVINDTVPSICFFCRCLGVWYSETAVITIGRSIFPKTQQEMLVAYLTTEVCRAYRGESIALTADLLVGKVGQLVPCNSFQLERELKQCASCCVPLYDDIKPHTALLALNHSRNLNNCYQTAFLVVLAIEVLARLVNYNALLRFEFEELSKIIINYNYDAAADNIENYISNIQENEKMIKQLEHDISAALKA